jgi:hypothetical protein
MDEVRALFLSLPSDAQTHLRTAVRHKEPVNHLKLARVVYPYVQTLAEATEVADFLVSEVAGDQEHCERRDAQSSASVGAGVLAHVS